MFYKINFVGATFSADVSLATASIHNVEKSFKPMPTSQNQILLTNDLLYENINGRNFLVGLKNTTIIKSGISLT